MAPGHTSSGRVKVNLALAPEAYESLRQMAGSERGLGAFISELIAAEARWRAEEAARAAARRQERGRQGSELQATLARLEESEARYDRLVARLAAVVFEMTPDGRLVFANQAVSGLTGFAIEELLGPGWLDCLCPGDLAEAARSLVQECRRGDVTDRELAMLTRAGERLAVDVTTANQYGPDGELERIIGLAVDVTRQRRAQAGAAPDDLRSQREQYQMLAAELDATLSSIADGLVVYDVDGRIVRMNAAAEEMLGYRAETRDLPIAERSAATVQPLKPDGTPFTPEEYPAVRALRGEVVRNQEMILHVPARGGKGLRVSVSSAPLRRQDGANGTGSITGCVTTFTSTEAFHEANERLAQRESMLAKAAARLRQANTELEAVLAAMPNGLIVYDPAGKIVRMNEQALDMLGYRDDTWKLPVAERVGTAVQALRPDGTPYPREEYVTLRALRGEVLHHEEQYIHLPEKPEKDFWGLFSAGPIFGPGRNLAGAVVVMTNTNQLHEVSEQLALRQAELQQANAQLQSQADELRLSAERLEQRVHERTADLVAANGQLQYTEQILASQVEQLREQADLLSLTHDAIFVHDLKDATIQYWNHGAEERYGWTAGEALGQRSHTLMRTVFAEPLEAIYQQVTTNGRWEGELVHTRRDGTQITVASRWALKRDRDGRPQAVLEINNDLTEYKRSEAQRAAALRALEESREQLRSLSRRLVQTRESERRYVADQLFNEVGQVLAALRMHLSRPGARMPSAAYLAEAQDLLDRVMSDLHHLATNLRPATLDRLGLASAIRQYAEEWGRDHRIAVQFEDFGLQNIRLAGDVETAVYRIVQDALTNVGQHARAHTVGIALTKVDARLVAIVEDDGVGFNPDAGPSRAGVGLLGMSERAQSVGGQLTVESAPGKGTSVIVEIDLER